MARAADMVDGMRAVLPVARWPAVLVALLEERETMPAAVFDARVMAGLRTHLFGDCEDPGRDPDLGEPIG